MECETQHKHWNQFERLNQEAGGHRVQRVPPTERQGRVHTSTVTCAVLEENDKNLETIKSQDVEVQWYSGTGSGGQHRNKHQNSCRLIHKKTGMVATAQCRSRQQSYELAMQDLMQRLTHQEKKKGHEKENRERHTQVGSGMRGDKIRTYRFQDDSVKDHRTEKALRLKKVMAGDFNFYD